MFTSSSGNFRARSNSSNGETGGYLEESHYLPHQGYLHAMISTVSFHPFISHFSPALFVAGLLLLFLSHKRNDKKLKAAGAFNLSLGLLAAVVACFSGMVSVDINLRSVVDVEGHQGYAFLFTLLYGFSSGYAYTNTFSRTAVGFYLAGLLAMGICLFSGYRLIYS